jgi:uncharacterized membrane protein YbaN (DUF454 family)
MVSDERRRPRIGRLARLALGVAFFLLGVIGLLVPVMPQTIFFVIAAMLVAPEFPPARRFVMWAFRKWPALRRKIPRRYRHLSPRAHQHRHHHLHA